MAKSNQGSSMPNQGDRKKPGNPNSGKTVKQDAKVWKSKGIKNPSVPDWLA